MGFQLEDGTGTGRMARVDVQNRLSTEANVNGTAHYQAIKGKTFNYVTHYATAAAGEIVAYIKNTSKVDYMFVDLIRVGGVQSALWKLFEVTGTAAGGSAVTLANTNLASSVTAEATARGAGAITGLTSVTELATIRSPAARTLDIDLEDTLILGTDDAVGIEYDTGTTGIAEILIRCYFKNRDVSISSVG